MPSKVVASEEARRFHPLLPEGMSLTENREPGKTYRMKKPVQINLLKFEAGEEYVIEPEYLPTMHALDAIEAV